MRARARRRNVRCARAGGAGQTGSRASARSRRSRKRQLSPFNAARQDAARPSAAGGGRTPSVADVPILQPQLLQLAQAAQEARGSNGMGAQHQPKVLDESTQPARLRAQSKARGGGGAVGGTYRRGRLPTLSTGMYICPPHAGGRAYAHMQAGGRTPCRDPLAC